MSNVDGARTVPLRLIARVANLADWRDVQRRARKFVANPTTALGLAIMFAFLLVAILAPFITEPNFPNPYRLQKDMLEPLAPPGTSGHVLGTDNSGSDVFYGLVWGARLSIRISLIIVGTAIAIGSVIGLISGYFGGKVDNAMMRVTDVFFALPPYILAMAILATLGANLRNLMITLAIVFWPRFARVVRAQVLMVRESSYIEAAQALGARSTRVMYRHVLPNSLAPLLVQGTLGLGEIVLWTAGLAFIGLAPSDLTEWGNMVSHGQEDMIGGYWWTSFFPGLAIFLFVMGANLLGDGLRDALDPKGA